MESRTHAIMPVLQAITKAAKLKVIACPDQFIQSLFNPIGMQLHEVIASMTPLQQDEFVKWIHPFYGNDGTNTTVGFLAYAFSGPVERLYNLIDAVCFFFHNFFKLKLGADYMSNGVRYNIPQWE